MNVLVVEDDQSVVRFLEMALSSEQHTFDEYTQVREAWPAVREGGFDAAVIDIGLPGVGGWELVERIRHEPKTKSLPVVVITGAVSPSDTQHAEAFECALLEKPFDADALLKELARARGTVDDEEKVTVHAVLVLDSHIVEGTVRLAPEEFGTLTDRWRALLVDDKPFIAVDDARLSSNSGTHMAELPFVHVMKSALRVICPSSTAGRVRTGTEVPTSRKNTVLLEH